MAKGVVVPKVLWFKRSHYDKQNKQTSFFNKIDWYGRSQHDKQNKETTFLN
jgi:hypothetical protein